MGLKDFCCNGVNLPFLDVRERLGHVSTLEKLIYIVKPPHLLNFQKRPFEMCQRNVSNSIRIF